MQACTIAKLQPAGITVATLGDKRGAAAKMQVKMHCPCNAGQEAGPPQAGCAHARGDACTISGMHGLIQLRLYANVLQ